MDLKSTLRWSIILSILFTLVIVVCALYSAMRITTAISNARAADEIVKSAFTLSSLTADYLAHPTVRALTQWRISHSHIATLLNAQAAETAEAQDLLQSLREKNAAIGVTFESTIAREGLPRLTDRAAAQFRINADAVVVDASRLAELYYKEQADTRRAIVIMLALITFGFATTMIVILSHLYRRVIIPLTSLRLGAEAIARGNFSTRLQEKRRDELGLLAQAFNDMAAKLQSSHAELERKILELREQDDQKNTFIAILSHELRNPLAPIISNAEYGKLLLARESEAYTALDIIDRQARNMKLLLEDLLDVSRMIRGKIELRRERLDVRSLVRSALQTVEPLMNEKNQRIEASLLDSPIVADVDPLRLEQIITNLLTNASKFSDEGGVIKLTVEAKEGRVRIRIRDTGIGMSAHVREKVFDLFYQARDGDSHASQGFGIGLPLARALAELHGGTVQAESQGEGKGSEFTVVLPLAPQTR